MIRIGEIHAVPLDIAAEIGRPPHGTAARYGRGCRCEHCTRAQREYRKGQIDFGEATSSFRRLRAAPTDQWPARA